MLFRRIQRGHGNRVFKLVRNASLTAMAPGIGVVYHVVSTVQEMGNDVTFQMSTRSVGMLAGIVSFRPIQPGAFGLVLGYGPATSLLFYKAGGFGTWTIEDIVTHPLSLSNVLTGYFATYSYLSTHTTQEHLMCRMVDVANMGVLCMTSAFHETVNTQLGYVNGWIRAL